LPDAGEECDDGPANSDTTPDACRTDCTLAGCGDGTTDSGEECDDGNTAGGDGCEADCTLQATTVENLVENGDFSDGTAPWKFSTNGSGSYTVAGGEARLAIVIEGTRVQFYQRGLTVDGGTTYRLTLRGRHTNGRDVKVRLIQHADPYANYGLNQSLDLGTTMKTFEMTFVTPAGSLDEARLSFLLAPYDQDGTEYHFDDIVLERLDP
jgi:cysteine-rich repeat protein